jgi:hypothetical protein
LYFDTKTHYFLLVLLIEASQARETEEDPKFYMFKPEQVDEFRRPDFDDLKVWERSKIE